MESYTIVNEGMRVVSLNEAVAKVLDENFCVHVLKKDELERTRGYTLGVYFKSKTQGWYACLVDLRTQEAQSVDIAKSMRDCTTNVLTSVFTYLMENGFTIQVMDAESYGKTMVNFWKKERKG